MEIISTFKERIIISTKDFKSREWKDFEIKLVRNSNNVEFQMDIPKFMLTELRSINPQKYDNYKNFLRLPTLGAIKGTLDDMSFELEKHHSFEDKYGDKMLFIHFNGKHIQSRNNWHGANTGIRIDIGFQYFVGYKFVGEVERHFSDEKVKVEKYYSNYELGITEKHLPERRNNIVPLHHQSGDIEALKAKYLIVPYTEEREQFLKEIQDRFISLTDNLNNYLNDLDVKKLDQLISEFSVNKLLGDGK